MESIPRSELLGPWQPRFISLPDDVLHNIFEFFDIYPTDSSHDTLYDRTTPWKQSFRAKREFPLVCRSWLEQGTRHLYKDIYLHRVGQIPALVRTLKSNGVPWCRGVGECVQLIICDFYTPRQWLKSVNWFYILIERCPNISAMVLNITANAGLGVPFNLTPLPGLPKLAFLSYGSRCRVEASTLSISHWENLLHLEIYDPHAKVPVQMALPFLHTLRLASSVSSTHIHNISAWSLPSLTHLSISYIVTSTMLTSEFTGTESFGATKCLESFGLGLTHFSFADLKIGYSTSSIHFMLSTILHLIPNAIHLALDPDCFDVPETHHSSLRYLEIPSLDFHKPSSVLEKLNSIKGISAAHSSGERSRDSLPSLTAIRLLPADAFGLSALHHSDIDQIREWQVIAEAIGVGLEDAYGSPITQLPIGRPAVSGHFPDDKVKTISDMTESPDQDSDSGSDYVQPPESTGQSDSQSDDNDEAGDIESNSESTDSSGSSEFWDSPFLDSDSDDASVDEETALEIFRGNSFVVVTPQATPDDTTQNTQNR